VVNQPSSWAEPEPEGIFLAGIEKNTCQSARYQVVFIRLKTLVQGVAPYGTREMVFCPTLTMF
jgi:hypothetical protein